MRMPLWMCTESVTCWVRGREGFSAAVHDSRFLGFMLFKLLA